MKFRVTSKTAQGEETTRVIEAASRLAVYEQTEKEGSVVVSVQEGSGSLLPAWTQITIGTGVKSDERITFTKNLAAMLTAGLPLTRALSVIDRQTKNKALKKIVADLETEVKKGSSFHEALALHPKIFSRLFIAMTKAGEEGGKLADTLRVVANQMETSRKGRPMRTETALVRPSTRKAVRVRARAP